MEEAHYVVCISCILGIACLIFSGFLYKKSIETNTWRSCKGEILHSLVDRQQVGTSSPSYKAKIEYKYTAENQVYFSKRIYFGSSLFKFSAYRKEADSLVEKFRVGDSIDVFYNPRKPDESVLIQGVNSIVYIVFGSGLVCIVIAVFLMLYY